jgi:hypothetical protein
MDVKPVIYAAFWLLLLYLPVALLSKYSYISEYSYTPKKTLDFKPIEQISPPAVRRPKGTRVVELRRPFERFGFAALARYWSPNLEMPGADDPHDTGHSEVLLYENETLLGPPHSFYRDVGELGQGRYAHLKGLGFAFSASDNSDPNTNNRHYWAVVP